MKLWYQSMTRPDAWPAYQVALKSVLDAAKDPGTEIEVHGIEKRGGVGDQYRYLEFIETAEILENVERALRERNEALEAADRIRAKARADGYAEREVLTAESGFKWPQLTMAAADTLARISADVPTSSPPVV